MHRSVELPLVRQPSARAPRMLDPQSTVSSDSRDFGPVSLDSLDAIVMTHVRMHSSDWSSALVHA
jgi:hypothetical protein